MNSRHSREIVIIFKNAYYRKFICLKYIEVVFSRIKNLIVSIVSIFSNKINNKIKKNIYKCDKNSHYAYYSKPDLVFDCCTKYSFVPFRIVTILEYGYYLVTIGSFFVTIGIVEVCL